MRLYGPKPKKFWMPQIIVPPSAKFVATVFANYSAQFYSSSLTSGTGASVDVSITIPSNIPAGALLVLAFHTSSGGTLSGAVFGPTGLNLTLTQRGTGKPYLFDVLLPSGLAAGTYVFRPTLSSGNWQFARGGLVAWYITGQTVNAPESVGQAPGNAVTGMSVTSGRAMIASANWTSNNTATWSLSTVVPSTTHGNGTPLNAAEWTANLTTTASWTVASSAGTPTDGTVAATYR